MLPNQAEAMSALDYFTGFRDCPAEIASFAVQESLAGAKIVRDMPLYHADGWGQTRCLTKIAFRPLEASIAKD